MTRGGMIDRSVLCTYGNSLSAVYIVSSNLSSMTSSPCLQKGKQGHGQLRHRSLERHKSLNQAALAGLRWRGITLPVVWEKATEFTDFIHFIRQHRCLDISDLLPPLDACTFEPRNT